MVHRDLHLGNWMVLPNNEVKLLDFGLSLIIGENTLVINSWGFPLM